MSKLICRKLKADKANKLMNWAEENGIDYSIRNIEEFLSELECDVEIEMTEKDWETWESLGL